MRHITIRRSNTKVNENFKSSKTEGSHLTEKDPQQKSETWRSEVIWNYVLKSVKKGGTVDQDSISDKTFSNQRQLRIPKKNRKKKRTHLLEVT